MEITGDPPPLWPQRTATVPRRKPPSPIFNLPVLIILLPIIALILLSFVVPPFLSVTAQILKPIGVKKGWDSLNVFLVLFAIICGVLARRNDDDDTNNKGNVIRNESNDNISSDNRKVYDDGGAPINVMPSPATSVRRLKRSSSSYPDLRQDSLWENNNEDRFRFFDDFEINKYRSSLSYNDRVHELRRNRRIEFEEPEPKVIPVDTFVLRPSPSKFPSPSTPPPPPPPPLAANRHKPRRRTYQVAGQKDKIDRVEFNEIKSPSVTPPPPPPPPPRRPPSPLVSVGNRSEQKYTKLQRRRSNATKEIKMVFASLRKRKKKHKSKDYDQDCPLHSPTVPPPYYSTTIPPSSLVPPPPPPPLPPSSVFQKYNLFRKGSKSKKIHSVPAPPPPPPPAAATFSFSKRSSKQNTQIIPPTTPPEPSRRRTTAYNGRPPLPTKANTASYYDENVSGGQSPLIPMPPPSPPPPPPFKMSDFKFVIRGDFVKIRSSPSSRCSSPDLEEDDHVSSIKDETETVSMVDGYDDGVGVAAAPVYCPSPDVNAKAETFIARLRDGWKLEKINSLKEKQGI